MVKIKQHNDIDGIEHKHCSKCNQWQYLDQFVKSSRNRDGLRGQCKACERIYKAAYMVANKDEIKRKGKIYRLENKDKIRKSHAAYHIANRDKRREDGKVWRASNKEKCLSYRRPYKKIPPGTSKKIKKHKVINGVELKHCYRCDQWLGLKLFYKAKDRRDGLMSTCKVCFRIAQRLYEAKNRKEVRERGRRYRAKNAERVKATSAAWKERNKEKLRECNRIWIIKNKKKILADLAKRRKTPKVNLCHKMSSGVRHSLKGKKNGHKWESLVGYTADDLIKHLNKTIPKGCSWDDYVSGRLHVDHIIPVSAFNFESPDHIDFLKCWGLKNLQLLPAHDNHVKYNKLAKPFQPSLLI